MIAQACGLRMGVGWFSRPLGGVEVRAMLDEGLDTTRRVESVFKVPQCAAVL
jgi:hypothetical protein